MPTNGLEHLSSALALGGETFRRGGAVQDVHRAVGVAREAAQLIFGRVAQRIVQDPDIVPRLPLARGKPERGRPLVEQQRDACDVRAPLFRDLGPGGQHDLRSSKLRRCAIGAHVPSPRIMLSMRRVGPTRAATIATLSLVACATGRMSLGSTTAK